MCNGYLSIINRVTDLSFLLMLIQFKIAFYKGFLSLFILFINTFLQMKDFGYINFILKIPLLCVYEATLMYVHIMYRVMIFKEFASSELLHQNYAKT